MDISQLSVIPYIDAPKVGGRFISSLSFYAEGRWRMWIEAGDRLIEMKAWPAEALYFSAEPQEPNDFASHFLDFIAQRASYPEVKMAFSGLHEDMLNLATSFAKIAHFHAAKDQIGTGVTRMVETEVEYLLGVCRSMFDLLQEIAAALWEMITPTNPVAEKKPLKQRFREMVQHSGRLSTKEEVMARFGLPDNWASYYVANAPFFMSLRKFRDDIVHRGVGVQAIFTGDRGFLISHSLRPFTELDVWEEAEREPNDLVPLVPALAVAAYKTLAACEGFTWMLERCITFPGPIVPDMHLFVRGYFNDVFGAVIRDAGPRLAKMAQRVVPQAS